MLSSLTLFDDFFDRPTSVYVVSESQLDEWKRQKAEAEIIEIDKLIDSHKLSIDRLTTTREELRKEYPPVSEQKG